MARCSKPLLATAAAIAALCAAAPAAAASYQWAFIGGCGSADWLGATAGPNASGALTCWSLQPPGSGWALTPPSAGDDVRIAGPAGTPLLVNLAQPSRAPFEARARDIRIDSAGLAIDRHALAARSLTLGAAGGSSAGIVAHSAGVARFSAELRVHGGSYVLSGGMLKADVLGVVSMGAAASFAQSAGSAAFERIDVASGFGQAADLAITGGTLASGSAVIGRVDGHGGATATLSGHGTRWQNGGLLTVGDHGNGALTVAAHAHARVESASGVLGARGGAGRVTASGGAWVVGGDLVLGRHGSGAINVYDGGAVLAANAVIGETAGHSGSVQVDGAFSTFGADRMVIGAAGSGSLKTETMTLLHSQGITVGQMAGGSGSADFDGNFLNHGALVVGDAGSANVTMTGGGFNHGDLTIGRAAGGQGNLRVDGFYDVGGALQVGWNGSGVLVVDGRSRLIVAGDTHIGPRGTLVLRGGLLASDRVFLGNGNAFEWHGGVLAVTGSAGSALDDVRLPAVLTLRGGRTLQVEHTLQVGAGSALLLGGGTLIAGTLAVDRGLVAAIGSGAVLEMNYIGTLHGQGQVAAAIVGGDAAQRIVASGSFALGTLSRRDGFAYQGVLEVGGHEVTLLDADTAVLGSRTLIGDGGRLVSLHGARLGSGSTLEAAGAASVVGAFVNDGVVSVAPGGRLTFLDRVSGAGGFGGDVVFEAGYAPGPGIAQIAFDGDAAFGTQSLLTLQVNGSAAGSFGRLSGIETLQFNGRLQLVFGAAFDGVPGTTLALFDFDSFDGALGAGQVLVEGFDRSRIDFSRLAIDGTLTVTAVPEPATWALWLGAAALLGARRLRRG